MPEPTQSSGTRTRRKKPYNKIQSLIHNLILDYEPTTQHTKLPQMQSRTRRAGKQPDMQEMQDKILAKPGNTHNDSRLGGKSQLNDFIFIRSC